MNLFAVSVYDSAVGAYSPPIFAKSKGEAIRSFSDACNDSSTAMSKHPQDYILLPSVPLPLNLLRMLRVI